MSLPLSPSLPFSCFHHLYHNVVCILVNIFSFFSRFLGHVPVVYVDYPGSMSLTQIYGTFNRVMLQVVPNLRAYSDTLTNAMVEFIQCYMVREREENFRFCDVFKNLSFAFFSSFFFPFFFPNFFVSSSLLLPFFPPPSLSPPLSPSLDMHGLQLICNLITYTVLVK